jgi:hypothetical protein
MPHIEFACSVDFPWVIAVDGTQETPIVGGLSEGMGECVAEHKGDPMGFMLSHGHLEAIVIGEVTVRQQVDVVQIWEFSVKRLGRNLI